MRNRITKVFAGLAALGALALGGAALASAGQGGSQPAKPAAPATAVQQGSAKADVQTAEKPGVETSDGAAAADTDSIQDENGKDDATEQPGAEQSEGSEAAESGSEVPGDDGPGGHADEPDNPNADHQFEGQE